jgi:hypothetical protein
VAGLWHRRLLRGCVKVYLELSSQVEPGGEDVHQIMKALKSTDSL